MLDTYEVHPCADIFPMMTDGELDELAEDIRKNGLRVPIVLNDTGAIIDGRNRYLACKRAEVEPWFETKSGNELALVVSLNVKRRSLRASRKAIAAAEAWELVAVGQGKRTDLTSGQNSPKSDEDDNRTRDLLASLFGVSAKYVQMARAVLADDPIAAAGIKTGGELTLQQAYDAAMKRKGDVADDASKMRRLAELAPDLAESVPERMSLDDALGKLAERQRLEREAKEAATRLVSSAFGLLDPGEQEPQEWAARLFAKVDPQLAPDLRARWKPAFITRLAHCLNALALQWESDNGRNAS